MATQNIDSISLQIKSATTQGVKGIDKLTEAIEKLESAYGNLDLSKLENLNIGGKKGESSGTKELEKQAVTFSQVMNKFASTIATTMGRIRGVGRVMGGFISQSSDYVENLNLFTASMGSYADEMQNYAEKVGEIMGIDPSEWMRYQGVFNTMLTGYGVSRDKAALMSKNLTQLGYDIASFYNVDFATAQKKLQSGLAGQTKAVREYGFDLMNSTLQQVALDNGIQGTITTLGQAEKAQLRYIALMTQVTAVQGDMGRTLNTPANQMRILTQQISQLGRAIGNTMIPMINKALPALIAFAKAIRVVINSIAKLLGFQLPEVDYSGIKYDANEVGFGGLADDADAASNSIGGATAAAEKYKKTLLGIDELHLLNDPKTSSGSGGGTPGAGGADDLADAWDFDLPEYDFLSRTINSEIDKIEKKLKPFIEWIQQHISTVLNVVTAIGAGLIAWKVTDQIATLFNNTDWHIRAGVALTVAGLTLSWEAGSQIADDGAIGWDTALESIGGMLATGLGMKFLGEATGLIGGLPAFALGMALAIAIEAISYAAENWKNKVEAAKKEFYGSVDLTDAQIELVATALLSGTVSTEVSATVDQITITEDLASQVNQAITDLNNTTFMINAGVNVPQETLNQKVQGLITSTQEYLDQNLVTVKMAFNVGSKDRNDEAQNVVDKVIAGYESAINNDKERLNEIGDRLAGLVAEGISRTELMDPDSEVNKLIAEAETIATKYQQIQTKSAITLLGMTVADLNEESVKALVEETQRQIDTIMEGLQPVYQTKIQAVEVAYEEGSITPEEREYLLAQIEEELRKEEAKAQLTVIAAVEDVVFQKLEPEKLEGWRTTFNDYINGSIAAGLFPKNQGTVNYLGGQLSSIITPEVQAVLKDLISNLAPNAAELQSLKDQYVAAGETVPQSLLDGLNKYTEILALTGDRESMMDYITNQMIHSQDYIDNLNEIVRAGGDVGSKMDASIAQGIRDNIQIAKDGSYFLLDETGKEIKIDQATVEAIAKEFGFELPTKVGEGLDSNTQAALDEVTGMTDEIERQVDIEQPETEKKFEALGEATGTSAETGINKLKSEPAKKVSSMIDKVEQAAKDRESGLKTIFETVFGNGTGAGATGVSGKLATIVASISALFTDTENSVGDNETSLKTKFETIFGNGANAGKTGISGKVSVITGAIASLFTSAKTEVGNQEDGFKSKNKTAGETGAGGLKSGLDGGITENAFKYLFERIETYANSALGAQKFKTLGSNAATNITSGISDNITSDAVEKLFSPIWSKASYYLKKESYNTLGTNAGSELMKGFNGQIEDKKLDWFWGRAVYWLTPASYNTLGKNAGVQLMQGFKDSVSLDDEWLTTAIYNPIKKALDWFKSYKLPIQMPNIEVVWTSKTEKGWTMSYPSGFRTYAQGGFPDNGEVYIAREDGSEMIGRIGNRNAVANNDQIATALARALQPMLKQNGNGTETTNISLYLDSQVVARAATKGQKQMNKRFNLNAFS